MATPGRRAASRLFGWLADRRIPPRLRRLVYGGYCSFYDVDASEVRLALGDHPSLGAFFVRRLKEGARVFPADPRLLPAPADGTLQSLDRVHEGSVLQAKGRPYLVRELLGEAGGGVELEGGFAWTIYLSPRDYHRVHAPDSGRLAAVSWFPGSRHSVNPKVLARRAGVLASNERAVLRLEAECGTLFLVMVGALNVGRIRVVGVEPGRDGALAPERRVARGEELARFEMGSTVVLLAPPGGPRPVDGLAPGRRLKMGEVIGVRA